MIINVQCVTPLSRGRKMKRYSRPSFCDVYICFKDKNKEKRQNIVIRERENGKEKMTIIQKKKHFI